MDLSFTIRNTIQLAAPREFAFGFIQDPRSMLTAAGCVEASGTAGPNGSGRLRFKYRDGSEVVNNWVMDKWDPPSEGVAHQWIQRSSSRGLDPVVEVIETNTFTSSGADTLLVRVCTYAIPMQKSASRLRRRAIIRQTRQGVQLDLGRLAADIERLGRPLQKEVTGSFGDHPDYGPYFASGE